MLRYILIFFRNSALTLWITHIIKTKTNMTKYLQTALIVYAKLIDYKIARGSLLRNEHCVNAFDSWKWSILRMRNSFEIYCLISFLLCVFMWIWIFDNLISCASILKDCSKFDRMTGWKFGHVFFWNVIFPQNFTCTDKFLGILLTQRWWMIGIILYCIRIALKLH